VKDIRKTFAWKTRQIGWACEIINRASSVIWWIDHHAPHWVSDPLYRVYWRLDAWASDWFCRAYEGSEEEIQDAWEHEDEDWLNPFQRMIANGRILPL